MVIKESTCVPERLEPRRGILGDAAELIVVDPLCHDAIGGVHHQPHTAQVIGDQPVRDPALDHVVRHIGPGAVDEPTHHLLASVQLGDR
jgi:hypothetical protein